MDQGQQVRRTLRTDRDARLAELRANLSGACFIDAEFFAPHPGPSFRIDEVYHPQRRCDVVATFGYAPNYNRFRGDRLDDALAYAGQVNRGRFPNMVAQQHGVIEVLDRPAFVVDDDWLALRSHIRGYLEATGSQLHNRAHQDVHAWFLLRDSHARGWPAHYDGGLHALATAELAHVDTDQYSVVAAKSSLERVEQTQRRRALYGDLDALVARADMAPAAGPGGP